MSKGFERNPYDGYVSNKLVIGKQYTCVWYVDSNKVLRME